MSCNEIRELLPDLAAGIDAGTPEMKAHLESCAACAAKLHEFKQTMALLDEWQAPEPSHYFDTRLNARLREEMALPAAREFGWFHWLRHHALAMSLAALVLAVGLLGANRSYFTQLDAIKTDPPEISVPANPGTAVADLQALEKNNELYADFDVLDQLQVQDDVTANP